MSTYQNMIWRHLQLILRLQYRKIDKTKTTYEYVMLICA